MQKSGFCLLFVACLTFMLTLIGCQSVPEEKALQDHGYRWYATSAEYEALCHQSFNVATMHLSDVRTHPVKHAIVIDVDETVLSNQPFVAEYIAQRKSFGYSWHQSLTDWFNKKQGTLIPGARPFLSKADALGYHIFYVTNRSNDQRAVTLDMLKALNLPQVSEATLKTREKNTKNKAKDKGPRIEGIRAQGYSVHLMIGDSLGDVAPQTTGQKLSRQKQWVNQHSVQFGTRIILLPNPVYGEWLWR